MAFPALEILWIILCFLVRLAGALVEAPSMYIVGFVLFICGIKVCLYVLRLSQRLATGRPRRWRAWRSTHSIMSDEGISAEELWAETTNDPVRDGVYLQSRCARRKAQQRYRTYSSSHLHVPMDFFFFNATQLGGSRRRGILFSRTGDLPGGKEKENTMTT